MTTAQLSWLSLKKQLSTVTKEIRNITESLELCSSSNVVGGYGVHETFLGRTEFLQSHTKPGREPSRAIVLLVLYVMEALKSGIDPVSEKSIKDYIALLCSQQGLKATNRGSIAGANIEVSAVCNILSALGLIEPVLEFTIRKGKSNDDAVLPDPGSPTNWLHSLFCGHLLGRWCNSTEQIGRGLEEGRGESVGANRSKGAERIDSVSTEARIHDFDNEIDFVDILIERSEHLEHHQELFPADYAGSRNEVFPDVVQNADSRFGNELPSSKLCAQRRGPSSSRLWKVCGMPNDLSVEMSSVAQNIRFLVNAEAELSSWSKSCAALAVDEEMEERIMRNVAALCGVSLPMSSFHLGTKYLKRSHLWLASRSTDEVVPSDNSVHDSPTVPIVTADVLIEKVRKSKRQRIAGSDERGSQHIELFDSSSLGRLLEVSHRNCQDYWTSRNETNASSGKRGDIRKGRSFSEPISLSEFMLNGPGVHASTSSAASSGSVMLCVPTLTTTMTRKYSRPTHWWVDETVAYPGSHSLVDLTITTVHVPWKSLSADFQTIDGLPSSMRCGADGVDYSTRLDISSSDATMKNSKGSNLHVYAPSYRLATEHSIVVSDLSKEEEEEDSSDCRYLKKHEHVLKQMRERWAMIQALKTEARKDNCYPFKKSSEAQGPVIESSVQHIRAIGRTGSTVMAAESGYDSPSVLLSPEKSFKVAKKRGRPPKSARINVE